MSGYRDSYFQYHHLVDSHQVLYNEWNYDEFPPPDEQEIGNPLNKNGNNGANASSSTSTAINDSNNSKGYNGTSSGINVYWDYFHDEEDWNLFKNVQLESNGMATFRQPLNHVGNDLNEVRETGNMLQNSGAVEAASSITGSIFNHRITKMAITQNSNWTDLNIPHPPQSNTDRDRS